MKKIIYLTAILLSVLNVSCRQGEHAQHSHDHDGHNHAEHMESSDHHGHSHDHDADIPEAEHDHEDGIIELSPEDAELLGVMTEKVQPVGFGDVLHVSGQIESAPTDVYNAVSKSAGIVRISGDLMPGSRVHAGMVIARVSGREVSGGDTNEAAYLEMEAAKRELDRITPLHADGIVSTRDYNVAEAAYKRAEAAYAGARSGSTVTSGINGIVIDVNAKDGEYVEVGTPIATIAKGERLTVRVDVPARNIEALAGKADGNIRFTGIEQVYGLSELNARRLTDRVASMNGGFVPVYYEIDNCVGNIVAGMIADVYLTGKGDVTSIAVPLESVSEQQGAHFVYKKLDEDCYKKISVTLGRNDGSRVEIKHGIEAGDEIVTKGMTFVKLAESKGAVPEGHTHNH